MSNKITEETVTAGVDTVDAIGEDSGAAVEEASGDNCKQLDEDEPAEREVKYRQWLIDRTNGNSKYDPESKPPCCIFFVPMPVKWLADYIEQNRYFERLGKFGFHKSENLKARKIWMMVGLCSNLIGWILTAWTTMAISTNYGLIRVAAFNLGFLDQEAFVNQTDRPPGYMISIGLRAVGYTDDYITGKVITFDEFCGATENPDGRLALGAFIKPEDCSDCEDASRSMIISLVMSLITYFPNLTTDVLRLYPNYDVNCQKVFGGFAAIFGIVMAIQTWTLYQFKCFRSFRWGETCFDANNELIDCDAPEVVQSINYYFTFGPGLSCLGSAAFLKFVDMLANLAIPTPTICRDHEEQRRYEFIDRPEKDGECENGDEKKLSPAGANVEDEVQ